MEINKNLQYLSDNQYWMYGPCFQVEFYFQEKRCCPQDFEKLLLSDPMICTVPQLSYPMSSNKPGRCILATGDGEKPLGFIYFGRNRGNYDYYYLATYPRQIRQHCGEFHWDGNADNICSVIEFHTELIGFVRRLYRQLNFHLVLMKDEAAPSLIPAHSSLNGILIYNWLAQQGNFGSWECVEYCYSLLPF